MIDDSTKLLNECDDEQLEAIRNCQVNCSRNECNREYLDIVLDNCTVNDIPQGYGETFCIQDKNNCSEIVNILKNVLKIVIYVILV